MKLSELIKQLQSELEKGDPLVLVPPPPGAWPPMPVPLVEVLHWEVNDTVYVLLHGLKSKAS